MGRLPLTYSRPSFVSNEKFRLSQSSLASVDKASLISGSSGLSKGIPDGLAFDNIMNGATCPPMTVTDFMDYLLYIEHSAENLQFYLWHQDYVKRFKKAPASDTALSPEWTKAMEEETAARLQKEALENARQDAPGAASAMFKGTDFDKKPTETIVTESNPFNTPPPTPGIARHSEGGSTYAPSTVQPSIANTCLSRASNAFAIAGVKTLFTIQPYRDEINRIISTYIMDGAPRQLNLSDRDRKAVLHALSYTTHPSALRTAFREAEASLRLQNHPNFVRWAIGNGNPARISFARTFGLAGLAGAFAVALLVTLSAKPRGWRAFAALGWSLAIGAIIASYRGMCVCMYAFHRGHRHVRPWELFADGDEEVVDLSDEAKKRSSSFDSFGGGGGSSDNSFEDEPWVARYDKRPLLRKIFDKETWIQEPAIRQIHDAIFLQSMLIGLLSTAALTALFLPLPAGNFF